MFRRGDLHGLVSQRSVIHARRARRSWRDMLPLRARKRLSVGYLLRCPAEPAVLRRVDHVSSRLRRSLRIPLGIERAEGLLLRFLLFDPNRFRRIRRRMEK